MTRTQPTSLGVPMDLLRDGGDQAAQAMAAITQARLSGGGGLRQQHLATAQRQIAGLDPTRHRALVQHLQGHVLALQGRGGDTKIAHVTPGEFVIPPRLQSPAVMAALGKAAKRAGIDPASLRVGSQRGKTNPRTGHQEFDDAEDSSSVDDRYAELPASQTPVAGEGAGAAEGGDNVSPAGLPSGGWPVGDDGIETVTVTTPPAPSARPVPPPMTEPTGWVPEPTPVPSILPEPSREDFQRVKNQIQGMRGALHERGLDPMTEASKIGRFLPPPVRGLIDQTTRIPRRGLQLLDRLLGDAETRVDNGLKKFDQTQDRLDDGPRAK